MNDIRAMSGYFRRLERALDCLRGVRRPFLERTRQIAEDFLQERPEATVQEAAGYLGEPGELAQGFLETLDPEVLAKHRRRKKVLHWGLAALAAALAIAAIVYLGIWVHDLRAQPLELKATETIIIYAEEPL